MTPQSRVLSEFMRLADVAVMLLALALALFVTQAHAGGVTILGFLTDKISPINLVFLALLCLLWPIMLEDSGLLRAWRSGTFRSEATAILRTVSIGALLLLVLVVLFDRNSVTLETVAVFWVLTVAFTTLMHLGFRILTGRLRQSSPRQVLIVGSGRRAHRIAERLKAQTDVTGYRVLGFVDDAPAESGGNGTRTELVTSIAELPAFFKDNVVDAVVVTLPIKSRYDRILEVSRLCEEQGIRVWIPSDLFDLKISNRAMADLGDEPLLTYYTGVAHQPWDLVVKRLVDLGGSAGLLLLLAPLFLVTAAAIKLTSPGPVLFRQERLGVNKRRFQVLKFRTMVQEAEQKLAALEALNEVDYPAFKLKNDPRLTPIGKFLRKTSIDELPQLINVLTGEMSLVGPRPLAVRDAMGISQNWQKRRFSVKPGITCLWQINGRSNVRFQDWMLMDLEYIDHWSIGLDFKILLKTIPAVLRGEGAA